MSTQTADFGWSIRALDNHRAAQERRAIQEARAQHIRDLCALSSDELRATVARCYAVCSGVRPNPPLSPEGWQQDTPEYRAQWSAWQDWITAREELLRRRRAQEG